MYILRNMKLSDYEEVVDMLYMFYKEVYNDRKIGIKYRFYEKVIDWVNNKLDIIVSIHNDNITGFSLCYKVTDGLTESYYMCDIAYVKEEYRKGRSAYMLYNNAKQYANENNLRIVTNSRIENGVSDMVKKHFKLEQKFIQMEGV